MLISKQVLLRNSSVWSVIMGSDLSVYLMACLKQAFRDWLEIGYGQVLSLRVASIIPVHPTAASPS